MLFGFLYAFVTAISPILIHIIGSRMPTVLMIFLSITFAIIVFHLVNYKSIHTVYSNLIKNYKLLFIKLSISLAIMWGGTFLIPIYFLPSILLISYMCIIGICGNLGYYFKNKDKVALTKAVIMIMILVYFYSMYFPNYNHTQFLILISSTSITALGAFYYFKISANFNKANFSSSQILAIRFWILWLTSLILVIYNKEFTFIQINMLPSTLLIAFVSLIIPTYCSQKTIEKLGVNKASIIMSTTPALVVLLQFIILHKNIYSDSLTACLIFLTTVTPSKLILLFYNAFCPKKSR